MNEALDTIIITSDEAGERLDKILTRRFEGRYSRTYFQGLIDDALVLVNGSPVKKRLKPNEGDEVEVEFSQLPGTDLQPENIPLNIIYEDDDILVVNKPVGMVVHPAPGHWTGTFVNALVFHCSHLAAIKDSLRPGIVHRLDKDTSGLLVSAKTAEAQRRLIDLFASRQVYKEYLAICVGKPQEGEIIAPIGRHPIHRKQMAIVPSGKPARSLCKVIGYNDKLSFVQMVITTGRTHQIRVHLKYRGSPVLGDPIYGSVGVNEYYAVPHQLLHAYCLRFNHPMTGQLMEFKASPPEDMKRFIKKVYPNFEKSL